MPGIARISARVFNRKVYSNLLTKLNIRVVYSKGFNSEWRSEVIPVMVIDYFTIGVQLSFLRGQCSSGRYIG